MTLDHLQRLELLAADGLASSEQLDQLRRAGLDPSSWLPVRSLLVELLSGGAAPDLSGVVLAQLGLSDHDLGPVLRQALAVSPPTLAAPVLRALDLQDAPVGPLLRDVLASDAPDLADEILAQLELDDPQLDLGDALSTALSTDAPDLADDIMATLAAEDAALAEPQLDLADALSTALSTDAPDLADDIMVTLGLEEPQLDLAEVLSSDTPDLAGGIMAALGIEEPGLDDLTRDDDAADLAPVVPLQPAAPAPVAPRRSWAFSGVAMAAAAALLLVFHGPAAQPDGDAMAFELAPINHVDIEALEAGDEVMVQVLQMDDNAPTIIFIDELEPLDSDAGGTPL